MKKVKHYCSWAESIAVPDVFKLYIMALLHKYEIREKRRMKHSSIDQAP